MFLNLRKEKHYRDQNYDFLQKSVDIFTMSFHKLMRTMYNRDAINGWGGILVLIYMMEQPVLPDLNNKEDNKRYLYSVTRNFVYFIGKDKKIRVYTISRLLKPTATRQGVKRFTRGSNCAEKIFPLGNAIDSECKDYALTLFSDFPKKVTFQNLYHD